MTESWMALAAVIADLGWPPIAARDGASKPWGVPALQVTGIELAMKPTERPAAGRLPLVSPSVQ
jgi:hypothetical protein